MPISIRNKWIIGIFAAALFVWALLSFRKQDASLNDGLPQEATREERPLETTMDTDDSFSTLRIETKSPDQNHADNVIFVKKKAVASFKRKGDKIFDETGAIPDGKMKFVNELEKTYGFENYMNGKLEGEYIEHYSSGQIKTQAQYHEGRLLERKVYFENGGLFSEEDRSNTAVVSGLTLYKGLKDTGQGKIYRFDGTIKYEWRMTDQDGRFYTKSFDSVGHLKEAFYYDKSGALIEHWQAPADGMLEDEAQ